MNLKTAYKYFSGLAFLVVVILLVGAVFYHFVEGWSYIDAFYFSSMTLTTVGYGDFYPVTTLGKIFSVGFAFVGVIVLFAFINQIMKRHKGK